MDLFARRDGSIMKNSRNLGFTLVELMIVVAIVGILAVVAAVGYRAIIANSKTAEPRQVLGSIRLAQEAYKAETGSYADLKGTSTPTLCPANGSTGLKVGWNPACTVSGVAWSILTVNPDGAVLFGYASAANTTFTSVAASPTVAGITIPTSLPGSTVGAGYWAYAEGNPGGGTIKLLTSADSKDIFQEP